MSIDLRLGDCLEVLPGLAPVDAVITDPPFGVNMGRRGTGKNGGVGTGHGMYRESYTGYDDTYENFVDQIVPRLNMALDKAICAAVFTGPHLQEQRKASAIGGVYCPAGNGRHAWGFKTFLPVLYYGTMPDLQKGASIPNVLRSSETSEKNGHPCPKPLGWITWLVTLVSRPGETILDPFMGSGTTGVACVKLGRHFIGIERDPAYFAIAERRIEQAQAQLALPLFGAP